MTKSVPRKLILPGKLTFDERFVIHRVAWQARSCKGARQRLSSGATRGGTKSIISDARFPGWQRQIRLSQTRNGSVYRPGFGAGLVLQGARPRFSSGTDQIDDFRFPIPWLAQANSPLPDEKWRSVQAWIWCRFGAARTPAEGSLRERPGHRNYVVSCTSDVV